MADEPSGGSVLKKWGPLAAIVLIAQVVVAYVLITKLWHGGAGGGQQEELMPKDTEISSSPAAQESDALPFYYSSKAWEHMTANPANTNAKRFVMFSVQLGLVGRNMEKDGKDITAELGGKGGEGGEGGGPLKDLARYDNKIKAIIVGIVREKGIDELEGDQLLQVQEEIREAVNREVMQKAFALTEENKVEITVKEVVFSDIIIQ